MKATITIVLGLMFTLGCSSDRVPHQSQPQQQPKAYTWAHFDFVHDDDKASYVNIGLSGGLGKFGLNIECPSKANAAQKLNAYVWVDTDELDRNADVRVKWDDAVFKIERWDVSSRALKPPQTAEFVKMLTTKNRLTVEYVPVGAKEPKTIMLPLAGAEAQLHQYCPPPLSNSQSGLAQDDETAQSAAGEPERRQATLAQQKICDEQAAKEFRKYNPKASPSDEYTSHYDAPANVCYMMVHLVLVGKDKSVTVSNAVTDAFEGRTYASYIWINSEGKPYQEVAPTLCTVKPRGQPSIGCKSSEEFESLVDQYFGVGR